MISFLQNHPLIFLNSNHTVFLLDLISDMDSALAVKVISIEALFLAKGHLIAANNLLAMINRRAVVMLANFY